MATKETSDGAMHEDTLLGVDKTGKTLDECANLCLSTPGCKYF